MTLLEQIKNRPPLCHVTHISLSYFERKEIAKTEYGPFSKIMNIEYVRCYTEEVVAAYNTILVPVITLFKNVHSGSRDKIAFLMSWVHCVLKFELP